MAVPLVSGARDYVQKFSSLLAIIIIRLHGRQSSDSYNNAEWKKLLFNKHPAILYAYAHLNIYAEDIKSEFIRVDGEPAVEQCAR